MLELKNRIALILSPEVILQRSRRITVASQDQGLIFLAE
jgi:hypothetical protein